MFPKRVTPKRVPRQLPVMKEGQNAAIIFVTFAVEQGRGGTGNGCRNGRVGDEESVMNKVRFSGAPLLTGGAVESRKTHG